MTNIKNELISHKDLYVWTQINFTFNSNKIEGSHLSKNQTKQIFEATPIQLEQIETEYNATKKKLDAVRRQQKAAYSGVNEVQTRKKNTAAAIERTQAALEMAKLNLSYCVVTAPCDGKLGRRALEEGQAVNAGQTITYIMPNTQKWVIAN